MLMLKNILVYSLKFCFYISIGGGLTLLTYNYYDLQFLIKDLSSITLINEDTINHITGNAQNDLYFCEKSKNNKIKTSISFNQYIKELNLESLKTIQKVTYIIDNASITQETFSPNVEWQLNGLSIKSRFTLLIILEKFLKLKSNQNFIY